MENNRVYPLQGISSAASAFSLARKKKPAAGKGIPLSAVTPLPPNDEGTHIYCAGLNYRDHAKGIQVRMAEIPGIPPAERIRKFIDRELKSNPSYLKPGDVISARISSTDGTVDLGEQRNTVVPDIS